MKKKITAQEVAVSALSCALATILLTVGVFSEILLFTGYLFAGIALMMPLAKKSYRGYILAYLATCALSLIFNSARFWDVLPFIMFFGLHPFVNELQLNSKINKWLACALKALWFDVTMYIIWRFVFGMTTTISFVDEYMVPILLVFGTLFFGFYDYTMYKCRTIVNHLLSKIIKK